jgi:hypothetical protein
VFFTLEQGTTGNGGFFEFQTQKEGEKVFDASKLLNIGAAMKSHIMGYIGTDTMPTCTKNFCWYIHESPFALT